MICRYLQDVHPADVCCGIPASPGPDAGRSTIPLCGDAILHDAGMVVVMVSDVHGRFFNVYIHTTHLQLHNLQNIQVTFSFLSTTFVGFSIEPYLYRS